MHQFSRSFARAHGINAAIIAGYLAHRITTTRKRPGEGYRCSLNELKRHYSYLSRTAIADALKRLSPSVLTVVPVKNWRSTDHTRHYAFASRALQRSASEDPIYFQIADAEQHGIPAALLLTNLRMRIADERAHQRGSDVYRVSARGLTEHLPLTRSTISRTLQRLGEGVIRLHRCKGFDRAYEVEVVSVPPAYDAPADSCGAKPDSCDAVPHVHAPNPDVYRTLKGDITKSSFESFNSYEARPAAPTATRACFDSHAWTGPSFPSNPDAVETLRSNAEPMDRSKDSSGRENEDSGTESARLASRCPAPAAFDVSQPFTPPPRRPVPVSLAELRQANAEFWRRDRSDLISILDYTARKVEAVINQQGVDRVFRWLAIHDDDRLFAVVREAVERCRCPKADLMQFQDRFGVDWFCAEWLVDACRQYLEERAPAVTNHGVEAVLAVLTPNLGSYYHENQEALAQEGLAYLRCGQEVWTERCQSPDVALEKAVHLSAAQKTKVFHNAVLSLNRGGYLKASGERLYGAATITKKGLRLVRRFLEINPNWTADDLLCLFRQCLERACRPAAIAGWIEEYATTRGSHLTYFMNQLEPVIHQLNAGSEVPAVSFPNEWATEEAA
ncbi:MAG: hypothetical protein EBT61_21920 [Verrucomicrobia bacterium]|nr:hypothetical protein [Verrucomicrobiota bacterium]